MLNPEGDKKRGPAMAHPRWLEQVDVAVLIPCLNEEATVGRVVTDLREALPWGRFYVGDNGSTDRTIAHAAEAGAKVLVEPQKGKGNVMRRLLRDVDAEIYLMIDGDATYDPKTAGLMVRTLIEQAADVVFAAREHTEQGAYRAGHQLYNRGFSLALRAFYRARIKDPLTGYRCLSRRFAKTFPALSDGFEIETEMNLFLVESRLAYAELPGKYSARPAGSVSKLSSYRDGLRIALFFASNLLRRRAWLVLAPLALLLTGWISISSQLELDNAPGLSVTAVLLALAAGFSWNHADQQRGATTSRINSQPPVPTTDDLAQRSGTRGPAIDDRPA